MILKITDLPATLTMKIEIPKWDLKSLKNGDRETYISMRSLECRRALGNTLVDALIDLDVTRTTERIDVRVHEERTDEDIDAGNGGALVITWIAELELVPQGEVCFHEVDRPKGKVWIDPDKCVECHSCWDICPADAVQIEER